MHWHHPLLCQAAKQNLFHGRRPNESDKYGHCGTQQMLFGSDTLDIPRLNKWECRNSLGRSFGKISTTTPNTIDLSAQPHHSMLILLGLAGNDLVQQAWKVRARFIAQEHQILPQHFIRGAKLPNSSNSGKLRLSCMSSSAQWHFGVSQTQNISAYPKALGHVGTLGIFNIIYPHPDAVSAGCKKLVNWENSILGLGTTPVKWCENVSNMRNLT